MTCSNLSHAINVRRLSTYNLCTVHIVLAVYVRRDRHDLKYWGALKILNMDDISVCLIQNPDGETKNSSVDEKGTRKVKQKQDTSSQEAIKEEDRQWFGVWGGP